MFVCIHNFFLNFVLQDVCEGQTNKGRISDGFIPPMVIPVEDVQDENKNLGTENENSGKSGHRRSSTYRVPYIDVSPIKSVPDITPMVCVFQGK